MWIDNIPQDVFQSVGYSLGYHLISNIAELIGLKSFMESESFVFWYEGDNGRIIILERVTLIKDLQYLLGNMSSRVSSQAFWKNRAAKPSGPGALEGFRSKRV